MVVDVARQARHALLVGHRCAAQIDGAAIGQGQRERHRVHAIAAVHERVGLVIAEHRRPLRDEQVPPGRRVVDVGGDAAGKVALDVRNDLRFEDAGQLRGARRQRVFARLGSGAGSFSS